MQHPTRTLVSLDSGIDEETVRALKLRASLVTTWAANDRETVESLLSWGVDGVITDEIEIVRWLASCATVKSRKAANQLRTVEIGHGHTPAT